MPTVAPQTTRQAAVDAAGALTTVVPVQPTDSPEPATVDPSLPNRVLPTQGVAAPDSTGPDSTGPRTTAQVDPPTEPLRIVAPLDDPEPSAEPRTAPLRIVAPGKSDDSRAGSKADADQPQPHSTSKTLTGTAGALLGG